MPQARRRPALLDHVLCLLSVVASCIVLCACGSGGGGGATPLPSPGATPSPGPGVTPAPGTPTPLPALALVPVATGLDQPLFVTAAPGDASRLFIVEQTGRIRILRDGEVVARPFADLSQLVSCCDERGLLGLAFHPRYADNGLLYVNYTDTSGNTVLAELRRSAGDPEVVGPEPGRVLFTVDQPFANHNGGMLVFGPDGFLYVGLGDGGGAGDPDNHAQRLDTKLGKILRIDVDTYPSVLPGNVVGGDPDIWDFGLRNPWRFSFDRATGDLYIGDVGQDSYEEVDVEPRGEGRRNYGWRITEGLHCYAPSEECNTTGLTPPALEYTHDDGNCSVTGGYVYRGRAIPDLTGRYFYADYCTGRIWSFVWADGQATRQFELTEELDPDSQLGRVSSFGEDETGELYVVSYGGTVFRLVPR
jgi:glucose/arabinose dehydrogenase